ncbi:ABC transporter permease [Corynebacterium yudongzhengii]|uniref:ABC transporter permease n=1 Tax=Corynebacterium yudongzhengii TaxID=2080740 RepID=A0A2U1T4V9_9CORY|nr:ABC transporter permease [Corynebacterium yudongzhengii]AWB82675.1 ABC transporter permease [Corynebacterium yudongzhengii]PWC01023.1 ABC transporter permease [Corynebacterium yudongzhengii]
MFINTLRSEWTKLRSTASFWWTTALVFVVSLSITGLTAALVSPQDPAAAGAGAGNQEFYVEADPAMGALITPQTAIFPYLMFGMAVVLIQAIMVVTTEYRFGLTSGNFLATPKRWPVVVAKLVLYGFIGALIALVFTVAAYVLTNTLLAEEIQDTFTPFEDEAGQRLLWVLPLVTVVAIMFVQGIGWLVRQTAGTVAITIILLLGFDQLLRVIPDVGAEIARAMPFLNMNAFIQNMPYENTDWPVWSSLAVFAAWAIVAWVAGLVVTLRRDA